MGLMISRYLQNQEKEDVYQRNENEERPDFMLATVEAWRREDIYVTKTMTAVTEKISSKSCVCVIGVPGAGKSTVLHYAALSLETKGYIIYLISGPEEFLKYYDINKKQIFVLDDAFGVYSVDQDNINSWEKHNESVRNALSKNTKMLVSIRTPIFKDESIREIVFLYKSDTTDHVDFSIAEYKLGIDDMRGIFTHCMINNEFDPDTINKHVKDVWGYTEKELSVMTEVNRQRAMSWFTACEYFSECFPLLCRVFANNDFVKQNPKAFFQNPFPALTKVFLNIRKANKHQFCALVLCTMFDGKLTDNMVSPLSIGSLCDDKNNLDKEKIEIRDYIMSTYKLKCPDDLRDLKSAFDSLTDVYILHIGDAYKILHSVFHDIVTYLYNDPLFVFKYGTCEFIRDRVRLNKDDQQHDPYVIVYSDDTNIERLADRLVRDLMSDRETGASFIINNPNIDDGKLISGLKRILCNKDQTNRELIDVLFRQCIITVWLDNYTSKHGELTQYKLIELCVQAGTDCNMNIYGLYPLHMSVRAGNLQLTKLLLHNGADKRRICGIDNGTVLQFVCRYTRNNKLELIKMLTQCAGDQSVVDFIANDRGELLSELPFFSGNLQLEEVLSNHCFKFLTADKRKMKHYLRECTGILQLVRRIHDNFLTYVNFHGRHVLHYSTDDALVTKYLFQLLDPTDIEQAVTQRDMYGKTPYWYVVNRQYPFQRKGEKVNDRDREEMLKLYRDNYSLNYPSRNK